MKIKQKINKTRGFFSVFWMSVMASFTSNRRMYAAVSRTITRFFFSFFILDSADSHTAQAFMALSDIIHSTHFVYDSHVTTPIANIKHAVIVAGRNEEWECHHKNSVRGVRHKSARPGGLLES
jgi:hypothetical protein